MYIFKVFCVGGSKTKVCYISIKLQGVKYRTIWTVMETMVDCNKKLPFRNHSYSGVTII